VGDIEPMTTPFTHKTENYYGSQRKIHTVSWKGKGEVDGDAIRDWCVETLGPAGYQEAIERTRWLDHISEQGEIFLCNDEDLTLFLLRWD
jgi:hypothetical protein